MFYRTKFRLDWHFPTWQVLLVMACAVAVVATINISVTYIVYVPPMVFLFYHIHYPKWMESALEELGRKSMPMWMIHTWYCNYLFQEQVYSLKYVVLILGGVIIVSYLTAIPVMWIGKKCIACIKL